MKKAYVSPVAEKLEFDYTNVVSTSVGGPTETPTTMDHKCVVIIKPIEPKPTEGISVKCVS